MLLTRTRVYCSDCGEDHEGEVVVDEGAVFGIMHCGTAHRKHLISSNADLYLKLRSCSSINPAAPAPSNLKFFLNFISITNACNFQCAVCAAHEPGEKGDRYLSVQEIVRRAEVARQGGARLVHLIGGEPTLHPDLPVIIRQLTRLGLRLAVVSNGYRLGREPGLARQLKQAGLGRVCLQFDSFEDATLHHLQRAHLPEKLSAIRSILDAGLNIGFNAIVTRKTLPELARLLDHHLQLGHQVKTLVFASAAPIGRYELSADQAVDRETIIMALMEAGDKYGFTLDDILPLPTYRPWGLESHPDCGVNLFLVRTSESIRPLNHYIDLQAAYCRLAAKKEGDSAFDRLLRPALYALMSSRRGQRLRTLELIMRILLKRQDVSIVSITIADYRAAMFLDRQRLNRCSSYCHTSVGPVRTCLHYFGGPHDPGSRYNEVLRGQC